MIKLEVWAARASCARRAAHIVLSQHESSVSRVVLLEDMTKKLLGTPVDVRDYFIEAISCLEHKLYRAGIVLAWAGCFSMLSEACFKTHEADIRAARRIWKFKGLTELKESVTENAFLMVAKDVGFISKAELRILDGQLSTRNQCAHPTLYRPSMNEAIGYVDKMIRQTLSCLPYTTLNNIPRDHSMRSSIVNATAANGESVVLGIGDR